MFINGFNRLVKDASMGKRRIGQRNSQRVNNKRRKPGSSFEFPDVPGQSNDTNDLKCSTVD